MNRLLSSRFSSQPARIQSAHRGNKGHYPHSSCLPYYSNTLTPFLPHAQGHNSAEMNQACRTMLSTRSHSPSIPIFSDIVGEAMDDNGMNVESRGIYDGRGIYDEQTDNRTSRRNPLLPPQTQCHGRWMGYKTSAESGCRYHGTNSNRRSMEGGRKSEYDERNQLIVCPSVGQAGRDRRLRFTAFPSTSGSSTRTYGNLVTVVGDAGFYRAMSG